MNLFYFQKNLLNRIARQKDIDMIVTEQVHSEHSSDDSVS